MRLLRRDDLELELRYGDYVPDQTGGLRRAAGADALLQRALFRLTARRGMFPFWETLGSRLWELGRLPAAERQAAARQYVAEALAEEAVQVESVSLSEFGGGRAGIAVELSYEGGSLAVSVGVGGEGSFENNSGNL